MNWEKQGLIFSPEKRFDWMQTHATTPVPIHLSGDLFRVFFSTRNERNQNQLGFIDIDINHPRKILNISEQPALKYGDCGHFDCDGVYGTSILKVDDKLYCYYGGWNAGLNGVFYSSIGVAISEDGGLSFKRVNTFPVLSRDKYDSWAVMAPFVVHSDGQWKMWYASGKELYKDENNNLKSLYDIKYATSEDGITWKKTGEISLALGDKDTNIARACVIPDGNKYECWYPYVSKTLGRYRIGYAESVDGIHFDRKDELAGIDVSESGWDSEAITYPYVIKHNGEHWMFYNGNEFGCDGFGLAKAAA